MTVTSYAAPALTLVLGIAALVATGITVDAGTIRREVPLGICATALFGWFVHDGLSSTEGLILLAVLVGVLAIILLTGRDRPDSFTEQAADNAPERSAEARSPVWQTVLGMLGVVLAAQVLVYGAIGVAGDFGLSGGFVGMTIVAIGTSLPEIVTSTQAASQGRTDLLVGNLLGSNMFNSLAVGGTVALLAPGPEGADNLAVVGVGAMVATSLLALVFLFTSRLVTRSEGTLLIGSYVILLPFLT